MKVALFAKNKPTERIDFGNEYVELQFLSKGIKDQIQSQITSILKEVDPKSLSKLSNISLESGELPEEIPYDMVDKIQEIEYYKLSKAIVKWSAGDEISIESIKELDEEVFEAIKHKVDEMSKLKEQERKN
jgi:hypothetical protein